ncbi:hypothetical protein D554_3543 [Bordetella holmesii 30539]|uniref:N-acetyltransferase YedL n=1 Tax=Bordetella holmesii 1058 TaxID=1247648 RepID=A0ABN0RYB4_9BORD|nr:hypothetical protein D558_3622 [Bordetella holmesii 44057]EWM41050.1 hypothetical protein D555_3695 [Bordetella holmesii 35009]EWM42429.1 hypothetical protein D556_3623 [Bordetella holmesii 41130]EXF88266.1 hypothetical protein D554_3543 [Bordetella holmesii 30539]EXX94268.1 hypothetical protein D559_1677 [Bordetella holmesii 1058]
MNLWSPIPNKPLIERLFLRRRYGELPVVQIAQTRSFFRVAPAAESAHAQEAFAQSRRA